MLQNRRQIAFVSVIFALLEINSSSVTGLSRALER